MFRKIVERVNKWMYPQEKFPTAKLYDLLFGKAYPLTSFEDIEVTRDLQLSKRPIQVAIVRVGSGICDQEKMNKIMELCADVSGSEEVLPMNDGCHKVILLFFRDTLWDEQVRQILEDIQKAFWEIWPDTRLYTSIGPIEDSGDESDPSWQKSFKIAIGLLDYRYVKQKGKIIAYSDIVDRRKIYPKGVTFRFDLLKQHLEDKDQEHLSKWVDDIDASIKGDLMYMMGIRYHLVLEIVVNVVSILREKGLLAEQYIGIPDDLINEVLSNYTPIDLHMWTKQFLLKSHKIISDI